jgi:hypothetical protein
MKHDKAVAELMRRAEQLSGLQPSKQDEIAAIGFMVGAVYALLNAARLGYDDARNTHGASALKEEFARTASALARNTSPENAWLAGFYFSSALMRIAALHERIVIMRTGKRKRKTIEVGRIVNKLKHETDAHVRGDWQIKFANVVDVSGKLIDELRAIIQSPRATG